MKATLFPTVWCLVVAVAVSCVLNTRKADAQVLKNLHFGGKFGLNFATLGGKDASSDLTSKPGFTLGGVVDFELLDLVAMGVEALYTQKGAKYNSSIGTTQYSATNNYAYLEIPALLKLHLPFTHISSFSPHLYAGPALGFNLSATSEDNWNGQTRKQNIKDNIKGTEVGLVFGGGVAIPVGPGKLGFDLRYNLGLTSIDNRRDRYGNPIADIRNRVFALNLSYTFPTLAVDRPLQEGPPGQETPPGQPPGQPLRQPEECKCEKVEVNRSKYWPKTKPDPDVKSVTTYKDAGVPNGQIQVYRSSFDHTITCTPGLRNKKCSSTVRWELNLNPNEKPRFKNAQVTGGNLKGPNFGELKVEISPLAPKEVQMEANCGTSNSLQKILRFTVWIELPDILAGEFPKNGDVSMQITIPVQWKAVCDCPEPNKTIFKESETIDGTLTVRRYREGRLGIFLSKEKGYSPSLPVLSPDDFYDVDGDGWTNLEEKWAGTDPKDKSSKPEGKPSIKPQKKP